MKLSNTQKRLINDTPLQEVRGLLIEFLAAYSVRKDMSLPILLMVGRPQEKMAQLMIFMRDYNPTESEIIQAAMELEDPRSKSRIPDLRK